MQNPASKRLPDPPVEFSPAVSNSSTNTSRLEDVREEFPDSKFAQRPATLKSAPEAIPNVKPTKSPSCPSFASIGNADTLPATRANRNEKLLLIKTVPRGSDVNGSPLVISPRPNVLHIRSQSNPSSPANASTDGPLTASASSRMSKRAHLIHEIVDTERLYAQDLALVRDAYLYQLRPSSHHSTSSSNASKNGGFSLDSRQTAYTFDTAGTSATSPDGPVRPSNGDFAKVPANAFSETKNALGPVSSRMDSARSDGSSNSTATANVRGSINIRRTMIPALTDVMSAADIKTVFLNLEQLATFSESLASSFESAVGDGSGLEPIITENASTHEIVVDRLGAVFQAAVSRSGTHCRCRLTVLSSLFC